VLFADLKECPSLVLAVSGGPDSTALMALAARWRASLRRGPRVVAVTVDHGLRPGSAREALAVKRLAGRIGVEHRTVRWLGPKPSTGIQEAARQNRYRLLAAAARKVGARHILTAHTCDDQAETVLFRLARGSGLTGLAGMSRITACEQVVVVRPFLGLAKVRLVATLRAAGIDYVEDPSNADPRFARTRLRRIMPTLSAEGLDAPRLARLARRLARAERALQIQSDEAFGRLAAGSNPARRRIHLDLPGYCDLPTEIALRVLGTAVATLGQEGPVELNKLEALLAAILAATTGPRPPLRLRRTLAGAMITLEAERLIVERAPPRRRGAAGRLTRREQKSVHPFAPGGGEDLGASLGRGACETYIASRPIMGTANRGHTERTAGRVSGAVKDVG
jgi:tRNA(Ile)-lysidine synthase